MRLMGCESAWAIPAIRHLYQFVVAIFELLTAAAKTWRLLARQYSKIRVLPTVEVVPLIFFKHKPGMLVQTMERSLILKRHLSKICSEVYSEIGGRNNLKA